LALAEGVTAQAQLLFSQGWALHQKQQLPEALAQAEAFELFAGDNICSGTPDNVGPVVKGDVIECHIDGLPVLSARIV